MSARLGLGEAEMTWTWVSPGYLSHQQWKDAKRKGELTGPVQAAVSGTLPYAIAFTFQNNVVIQASLPQTRKEAATRRVMYPKSYSWSLIELKFGYKHASSNAWLLFNAPCGL